MKLVRAAAKRVSPAAKSAFQLSYDWPDRRRVTTLSQDTLISTHPVFQLAHLARKCRQTIFIQRQCWTTRSRKGRLVVHDSGFFGELAGCILDGLNAVAQFVQFQALLLVFCAQALVFHFGAQMCRLLSQPVKAIHGTTKNDSRNERENS